MSRRRLDVTATQATASMLAALTGAIAASGLGIAGTIIGAALMSLASTVGAAVYKHYLARSREKLRAAAIALAPRTPGGAAAARRPPAAGGMRAAAGTEAPGGPATGASLPRDTAVAAAVATNVAAAILRDQAALGRGAGLGDPSALSDTPDAGAPDGGAPDGGASDGGASGAPDSGASPRQGRSRRRWVLLTATVLGVFVITMGLVTAVEAVAGKPLESLIWNRQGSGTTIGGLVGSHPSRPGRTHPAHAPSPSVSPSALPASTTPGAATPSPANPSAPASGGTSPPTTAGTNGSGTNGSGTNGSGATAAPGGVPAPGTGP